MKQRFLSRFFTILLGAVLVLTLAAGTAYADPGNWVLPWYEYDHDLLNHAIVSGSNVADTVSGTTQQSGDQGYYHFMNITFDYSLRNYLNIIAPAGGLVFFSDNTKLDIRTGNGDVYELAIVGTDSYMYSFDTGAQISMGDEVGKIYLLENKPMLKIQYLVSQESTDLFGLPRQYYTDGVDLAEYRCNVYNENQTSGTYSLPDLELVSMSHNGTTLYNTYQPNYPIFFNASVTVSGDFNSTYTVRWIVYSEYGNIMKWDDLTYSVTNSDNQPLFSWTPTKNGLYQISCIVDADESIAESNEDNNGRYFMIDVDDFR